MRLQRSDLLEKTLLYAGTSEYPTVLIHVSTGSYGGDMSSDNPIGAENQQERPRGSSWLNRIPIDLGHYIAGFVDGEGSFNVPIRRERDRCMPWRASLCFNVSQIGPKLPDLLRSVFGVGTVRGRADGVYYFEITRPIDLEERVFPFFERFSASWSEAKRSGDLSSGRGAGSIRCAQNSARHQGDPRIEDQHESWREASAFGSRDPDAVEQLGILRGHTQGSPVEARG